MTALGGWLKQEAREENRDRVPKRKKTTLEVVTMVGSAFLPKRKHLKQKWRLWPWEWRERRGLTQFITQLMLSEEEGDPEDGLGTSVCGMETASTVNVQGAHHLCLSLLWLWRRREGASGLEVCILPNLTGFSVSQLLWSTPGSQAVSHFVLHENDWASL